MYEAKILADSISTAGHRLTTMQVTFPRIVLAEFNTHRMFSRNSASSRAIPVEKMISRAMNDPFIPIYWGKNQKGMQAERELTEIERMSAEDVWLNARERVVGAVRDLLEYGVHKQIANRLLEPFLWHTVIISATEWKNFFALRCHKDAQPEIRKVAEMMRDLYQASFPEHINIGEWHTPLMADAEKFDLQVNHGVDFLKKVSTGRCARVSYLTHDGQRDPLADVELADRLQASGHMSPFEHVATPLESAVAFEDELWCGNFYGWKQFRKELPHEAIFQGGQ